MPDTLFKLLLAGVLALALMLGTAFAQDAEAPADAPAEDAAAQPAPEEAAEEEAAPAPPDAVLDPSIETEELVLRLVPLTKDELVEVATAWLGIVKAQTQQVIEAQIEAQQSEGDAASAALDRMAELTTERGRMFDNLTAVVNSYEKKGGDEAVVADFRAYRSAVLVEETRNADATALLTMATNWLTSWDGGLGLLKNIVIIIVALFILFMVARFVRNLASRWIDKVPNLSKLLQAFLLVVIYWLTVAVGLMIVLSALGVDITPLFALIGGASFIIAFAMQDTLGNLAAGLMIMVNRPFDEGDYVDVGGVAGTVNNVSISSTTVTTPDNQVIVIPNSKVWGNVITNVTTSATRRIDLTFGVGYDDSIEKVQQVLEETVKAHPLVLSDPEPVIRVHELADSSVNFICRPWVNGDDYWTVYWDLMRQVKERFDAEGISIPYPQQDLHVKQGNAPIPVAPPSRGASAAAGEGGDADMGEAPET
ncbi:mechanosensitive ion channel family protein [Halovulum sp. GXIMD14794]